MALIFVLAHGFGFSDEYWSHLRQYLPGDVVFFNENLKLNTHDDIIGIGHSLGFVKLNNSSINFKHLFGLQAFLDFCSEDDAMRRVRAFALDKMKESFKLDCKKSLFNFYNTCGYQKSIPDNIDSSLLVSELDILKLKHKHCGVKTTIIGGKYDPIVTPSIISENFEKLYNVKIIWTESIGHSMGTTDAEQIACLIKQELCI